MDYFTLKKKIDAERGMGYDKNLITRYTEKVAIWATNSD
jgi:hypothetical protein